jgi:hypothetical protein
MQHSLHILFEYSNQITAPSQNGAHVLLTQYRFTVDDIPGKSVQ